MTQVPLSLIVCPQCGQVYVCVASDKMSICPVCQGGPDPSGEIRIELRS